MTIEERIAKLEQYKCTVTAWKEAKSRGEQQDLRTYLNKNKSAVRREVIDAGCFKTLTIFPLPAIGGMVMENVDVFDAMFHPHYFMDLVTPVVDMIDETIGVMSSPDFGTSAERGSTAPQDNVEAGYAFVAMPMDPEDAQLEDVLDAIKEACERCGVKAERGDDPESNERITDSILESIRRAEYFIVDLTHSRANVYYEAGYAQGLGKTPIYVARQGTPLEFDLKDYPVIPTALIIDLKSPNLSFRWT